MNLHIMTPDEVLRWFKPETPNEIALLQTIRTLIEQPNPALVSAQEDVRRLEGEVQELEDTVEDLKR